MSDELAGASTRIFEVVLDGFDGTREHTDEKVLWLQVPSHWNARQVAMALLPHHKGARAIEPVEVLEHNIDSSDIDLVLTEKDLSGPVEAASAPAAEAATAASVATAEPAQDEELPIKSVPYLFSMQIEVWDEEQLLRAAREAYARENGPDHAEHADALFLIEGDIEVGACLIQILDQPVPGCTVLHSEGAALIFPGFSAGEGSKEEACSDPQRRP